MRVSLAEEIREISQVAPKDFDLDDLTFEPDDRDDDDQAAATEHYLLELGYARFFSLYFLFNFTQPQSIRPPQGSRKLVGS